MSLNCDILERCTLKSDFPNKLQRRTSTALYKHSPFKDFRRRTSEYTEIISTLYKSLFKTIQHRLSIESGMHSFFGTRSSAAVISGSYTGK